MIESRTFPFFRPGHSDVGQSAAALLAARDRLGGKGASLHALAALGCRVPAGFTIPAEWCPRSREAGGEWPEELRQALRRSVARLEELAGRRLGETSLRVAVRSGAAESMPGMMDTVLNVSSLPALERAVDQVFRSYWSDRAVAYRRERGILGLEGTAVTIQEMCGAECAGVAFTVDPAVGPDAGGPDGDPADNVIVEAVAGLGEGLVSGAITPDRYRLERPGLEVAERRTTGSRALLDDAQLRAVAAAALEIESRFGHPVDVEWALSGGDVWLLQARAIRPPAALDRGVRELLTEEARRLSPGGAALFARHNLDETLSQPTPMSWDLHRRFFRGRHGFLGLYRDLGFHPSARVVEEGFLALIGGRVYCDTDRAAEIFYGSDLVGWDRDAVRRSPSIIDEPPRDWKRGALSLPKVLRALLVVVRSAGRGRRLRDGFLQSFEARTLPAWTAWVDEESARDLSGLPASELLGVLEARIARAFGRFPRKALVLSYLAGVACDELEDFLERRLGSPAGREAARTLGGAADRDLSVQQNGDLARVARGELELEVFLERWGHRTAGEMELARPRWREEPEAVEALARSLGGATGRVVARQTARRLEVAEEERNILRSVERDGGAAAARELLRRLELARALIPWRENWKHHWMRGLALVRQALLALDERLGLDGQVFWLELDELRGVVGAGGALDPTLRTAVQKRHDAARVAASLRLPAVLDAHQLDRLEQGRNDPREAAPAIGGTSKPATSKTATSKTERPSGERLRGVSIASGRGAGRAWICDSPESACPFPPPFVLVCSSTDPGWTPIVAHAAGLVVERGGALSHGAIVCRDFGVPAVVVPDATRLLEPGEDVRVDGDAGLVSRGASDGEEERPEDAAAGREVQVPPEPWSPPRRPRLAPRVALGVSTALLVSLAIVGVPALGDLLRPVGRLACDWILGAGATPFLAIVWAAAVGAGLATLAAMFVVDRGRLRALRARLAWYRDQLRRLRGEAAAEGAERASAALARRRRQATTERALELMRPVVWSFLPFVIAYLWIGERFPAEPLRPGTSFEVRATFQPAAESPLRYARLDVDEPSRLRLLDSPWKKLTPNRVDPERGAYRVVWAAEARDEGPVRLTVTARRERLEDRILVTGRRAFEGNGTTSGAGEITALDVDYPPLRVELPGPVCSAAGALSKWMGGGELQPRDLAAGPLTTFLVLAIVFAFIFQRCSGVR